jgi:hypothetical protein
VFDREPLRLTRKRVVLWCWYSIPTSSLLPFDALYVLRHLILLHLYCSDTVYCSLRQLSYTRGHEVHCGPKSSLYRLSAVLVWDIHYLFFIATMYAKAEVDDDMGKQLQCTPLGRRIRTTPSGSAASWVLIGSDDGHGSPSSHVVQVHANVPGIIAPHFPINGEGAILRLWCDEIVAQVGERVCARVTECGHARFLPVLPPPHKS